MSNICKDCGVHSAEHAGWYAEFLPKEKIMRCPECGDAEQKRRWKERFGDRELKKTSEVNKEDRIQHAKDRREAGISPWIYRNT